MPCAAGTRPAATAAPEPPLEPLVDRLTSQGLRAGPNSTGSQVGAIPNSGQFALPTITRPARRSRTTSSESNDEALSRRNTEPSVNLVPLASATRSLSRYGTPANGPLTPAFTRAAASSNIGVTTAFSCGFSRSIRPIAHSTSSAAVTSPRRTSSAWPLASSAATSDAGSAAAITAARPCGCALQPPNCPQP